MGLIGKFVVRVADLVEAEGRQARREVVRLIVGGVALLMAALMFVGGMLGMAFGGYALLAEAMHPGAAMLVVGVVVLLSAGAPLAVARSMLRVDDLDDSPPVADKHPSLKMRA